MSRCPKCRYALVNERCPICGGKQIKGAPVTEEKKPEPFVVALPLPSLPLYWSPR